MAYIVALAEALIHPTLISSTHILITVLLICGVVVYIVLVTTILYASSTHNLTICFIPRAAIELSRFLLFEVALFSELVVRVIFWIYNVQFTLVFRLFDP